MDTRVSELQQSLQLERLYATSNGKLDQPYTLAARSAGASPAQMAELRRLANLLPPMPAQRSDAMPTSIGLFRAESVDYVLVKAQQGATGGLQFMYLLIPAPTLRSLAGNIRVFEAWAREPVPVFAAVREDLPPFQIEGLDPAEKAVQVDDLLALLTICKNNMKTVSGLLAGLVQAMGIAIINAPSALDERITFIQGLLALLPAPVRAGITWATSVIDPAQTNTQIKFLAWDVHPARHLVLDWKTGKLLTPAPDDMYSSYMISQFRLDPELVVDQTTYMERTTVWRTMRKDDLANALAWASRRASLDSAILNGQPADSKMVAGVLREDPTLSDEMRARYARHILAITLSTNEPERSDILVPISAKFRNVADAVFEVLKGAATDPARANAAYNVLSRWITTSNDLDTARWRPLLSLAALRRAGTAFATNDRATIASFLEPLLDEPPSLALEAAIAQMIGAARKFAYEDPNLARILYLLGVTYLSAGLLQRLMTDQALLAQLPEILRLVVSHLRPDGPRPAPANIIVHASEAYGESRKMVCLARLTEWAMYAGRIDLIDPDVLRGLIAVVMSPSGARFDILAEHIVTDLSQPLILRTLDEKAIRSLVAISLARNRPETAIAQLEFYQNELYKGAPAEMMNNLVQTLFRENTLTVAQINAAFEQMQTSQLRTSTRANAYFGVLVARNWSPEVDSVSKRLTQLISNDASIIPQIGIENALRLVQMTVDRHDVVDTLRLSGALVENSLLLGVQGAELVEKIFAMINWGPEMVANSLEVLRGYVRRAPINYTRLLVDNAAKRYGPETAQALEGTYLVRIILGGSNLNAFTEQVSIAAGLLEDMAATYHEGQEMPSLLNLRRTLESMPGGLSDAERDRLSSNLLRIAEQILTLFRRRGRGGTKADPQLILSNQTAPTNPLEALRWIGGHYTQGRPAILRLDRSDTPHLFGSRSVNILLRETDLIVTLFENLLLAFPEGTPSVNNAAFRSEVDSLWATLNLYTQRQIVQPLSENTILLAELVSWVGERGNERSLANNGFGQQLQRGRAHPRNVIDCLRWVNGYFGKFH
jgi:hypothetical protein